MPEMKDFRVRDPIHGFIRLYPFVRDIVDTPEFQRLRRVKQLSFAYLGYPGAEHTRFPHSLGVCAFSVRIFDHLISNPDARDLLKDSFGWQEVDLKRERVRLCLGSLLHDTGHAPFSHSSEDLFPQGVKHEDYSREVILKTGIGSLIDNHCSNWGITRNDVDDLFSSKSSLDPKLQFVAGIFAGEVDSDKMDYLLRDSLHAGVSYGRYDHNKLIESLRLVEKPNGGNPVLAIGEDGLFALEALVVARYHMFAQVYYHKIARIYSLHFARALRDAGFSYPKAIADYLKHDDSTVFALLHDAPDSNKHAKRVVRRDHFRLAYQSSTDVQKDEDRKLRILEQELENSPSFADSYMFDHSAKAAHKFTSVEFLVQKRNGTCQDVKRESSLIDKLTGIDQFRVFSDRDKLEEIEAICNRVMA